ncbi:PH domain-containing protein [Georgenia satyanarayanai]|uniref:PH domain-containing protein n=1 Tax=Georgenia satyanarayanai TaxID=860221 RepID=UPI002042000B|nr:PH domain-containing protein [Georgenia satyanarayanai]MCM3660547.1 PH domain-containing protein [Georgenia satyanarayanai]
MGSDRREEQPRVLLRQEVRRWEWVMLAVLVVAAFAVVWWIVTRNRSGSLLPMLPSTVFFAIFVLTLLRPKRVELRDTELVLRSAVRTRRVPYEEIVAVRGDIPSRIDWSTRLSVELRDGRSVAVPSTREPLTLVHELISERLSPS